MRAENGYSLALKSVLVLLVMAVNTVASPILAEWQDGSAGHLFTGWNTDAIVRPQDGGAAPSVGVGTLDLSMGVGGVGETVGLQSALKVTGARTGGDDLFRTTAFGTVNLTQFAGISFDFYAADTDSLLDFGVYFQSSVDSSVWFYSINPNLVTAATWQNFGASLTYSDAWYGLSVSGGLYDEITSDIGTAFGTALGGANQLGFYITHAPGPGGGQVYGIDDFGLTVPEPETYMALGMALLGMAFVFRKRITESLADARAMMQM